jgi:hypothetical protein
LCGVTLGDTGGAAAWSAAAVVRWLRTVLSAASMRNAHSRSSLFPDRAIASIMCGGRMHRIGLWS